MYCEMIQNDFIFNKFYQLLLSLINAVRYFKYDESLTAVLHIFGYFLLTLFSFNFLFLHMHVE